MFSGQGGTATLRNHRCFSRAGIVGGGEASVATSAGFFDRGSFTFLGVSGAGVGSQLHHCASFQSNSAFERDWPIYVLFAACGFLNFRGSVHVS